MYYWCTLRSGVTSKSLFILYQILLSFKDMQSNSNLNSPSVKYLLTSLNRTSDSNLQPHDKILVQSDSGLPSKISS